MTTLLHIDSSALGAQSVSRQLTAAIVGRAQAKDPNVRVVARDLGAHPLPHLTGDTLGQDPEGVLDEFLAADTIVIGVPRYNFGVPSTLKTWIDRIAVRARPSAIPSRARWAWRAASGWFWRWPVVVCMRVRHMISWSPICVPYWASWGSPISRW